METTNYYAAENAIAKPPTIAKPARVQYRNAAHRVQMLR